MTTDLLDDFSEALDAEDRVYLLAIADRPGGGDCGFRVRSSGLERVDVGAYGSRREAILYMIDTVLRAMEEDGELDT